MRTLALVLAACLGGGAQAQDVGFVSFASGGVGGGYYQAASAICDAVNSAGAELYCSPEPTSGSLYNLEALAEGEVEFALVQSDWHAYAWEGTDIFAALGPMANLRSVMSLYPESVTVLASRQSGIEAAVDLIGKRVDIGHPSSGRHATLRRLLGAMDMSRANFELLSELNDTAAMNELCAGNLDAVVMIVGHPNSVVARVLAACGAHLVPFTGPLIDGVFGQSLDYVRTTIPSSAYPQVVAGVPTYAVMATVVTRADVDAAMVRAMVENTLGAREMFETTAPILRGLDPARMAVDGLAAPLHEAAAEAFGAAGVQ